MTALSGTVLGGAVIGASAGLTNGLISGYGFARLGGSSIGQSLLSGLKSGAIGLASEAIIGGTVQGISNVYHGKNFWTGKPSVSAASVANSASSTSNQPADMTLDEYAARHTDNPKNLPVNYWPENNGSSVPEEPVILPKGTRLVRYGENVKYINDGQFFSSYGTSYEKLSLPHMPTLTREYEVLQDVLSYKGVASPWFGQPGGGIQYRFDNVAIDLLKWRIIK